LTGTHPDRLKEEQQREMTIELGFAWMQLPDGEDVGIVDVPGHRDFIENMLAGVGGIDAALLIVSADEGVMPQTREHLAILDLLNVKSGIVVLTKTDLIEEPEWLDLVQMDVMDAMKNTVFEKAPIVRVSSVTGTGINELIDQITKVLENTNKRLDFGRPRLPVDRVFSIAGFGTVVTGTLTDGVFKIGDEISILPGIRKARIRGLQTHKKKSEFAVPGSRVAINLSGVDVENINRGDVVCAINKYNTTKRFDAHIRLLSDISSPLKHDQEVKIFIGASEILARTRILGTEEIAPGKEGWVQFEPKDPVVAVRLDRFIIRRPSPGETMGGGSVINSNPARRHKRFDNQIIQKLEAYLKGTPEDILLQACIDLKCSTYSEVLKKARLESDTAGTAFEKLINDKQIIQLESGDFQKNHNLLICASTWMSDLNYHVESILRKYHKQYPLRIGIPREELKSRIKLDQKIFQLLTKKWNSAEKFLITNNTVSMIDHSVVFNPDQAKKIEQLKSVFIQNPYNTPGLKECYQMVGEEVFNALINAEEFTPVLNDVVFMTDDYHKILEVVTNYIKTKNEISVAEFRDLFNTSRKYALSFLEYLDSIGITIRNGDVRILRQSRN
jgi:selenocysteine-specific elongation factor